jgi:hypothetical protein
MDKATEPTPIPETQPAIVPDKAVFDFDLSDPEVVKAICKEARDAADTAIRKLQGQLPD